MSAYLRFQTSVLCPWTKRPLGLFRASGTLEIQERIIDYLRDPLDEALNWFDLNLTVPRVGSSDGRSLFWFRTDQAQVIGRLWEIVAILAEHDVDVRHIRATDPGMIVYRDRQQVAAIPNQRIHRRLKRIAG